MMRESLQTSPCCLLSQATQSPKQQLQQQNPKSSLDVYRFKEKSSPSVRPSCCINCPDSQKQSGILCWSEQSHRSSICQVHSVTMIDQHKNKPLCIGLPRLPWRNIIDLGLKLQKFVLTVLESRSPNERCRQIWLLVRTLSGLWKVPFYGVFPSVYTLERSLVYFIFLWRY